MRFNSCWVATSVLIFLLPQSMFGCLCDPHVAVRMHATLSVRDTIWHPGLCDKMRVSLVFASAVVSSKGKAGACTVVA